MDPIQKELELIRAKAKDINGVELVACVAAMVRFKIKKTTHKSLDACFLFPDNYPHEPIVIELKSKVLADRLLYGLSQICEDEAKKLLGQRQILPMVEFINKFIAENPLCVCSDEISRIKRDLMTKDDEIKLKQKTSQVILKLKEGAYYLNAKLTIPDEYPEVQVGVEIKDQNLPETFRIHIVMQAVEIARRCVQPPMKKTPKDAPFKPKPSLGPVCEYLVKEVIHTFPKEICPCCREPCLPENPTNISNEPSDSRFIERVYCKHLFHHGCLDTYMKTPPFTGGKKCPACGNRIYHEKWKITPELAEARWAHKEARRRELSEVVDFLE
ncbi:hypothetical protein LSH36_9g13043 [Paralvinella palmiformis]|uniref:RING-type domain-containing protein n=1 Tax=Paralvinella palmiformis TaxID=53620 RepID=A0AAD9KFH3_9ANNE|nr:hypothetical protein LSH36_9g13043 [Paralvinella palmiformis]